MTSRTDELQPGGSITIEFDFAPETDVSNPRVDIKVLEGSDPDFLSRLIGSPSVIGNKVLQRFKAPDSGTVDYAVECKADIPSGDWTIDCIVPVRDKPTITDPAAVIYLTEAEFQERFGEKELSDLLSRGNRFVRRENDSASMIDGYVASAYTLPLVSVPSIIKGWSADITRFMLWDERAPDEVRKRYDDALAQLKLLAQGIIKLPPGSDGVVQASGGLIDSYADTRVFTDKSLASFVGH